MKKETVLIAAYGTLRSGERRIRHTPFRRTE